MIEKAENYPVSTLLSVDTNAAYAIPRYQREYTWGKTQWESLFDDLVENDEHYYLGSIICINPNGDPHKTHYLELVDGQQRMTSLSILLAALYKSFSDQPNLSPEQNADLVNLKYKLVLKKNPRESKVIPQLQNNNRDDYLYVLSLAGVLDAAEGPRYAGTRRIVRAYRYFCQRIDEILDDATDRMNALMGIVEKVNTATLVQILVKTHAYAYTLFESLNNRGTPLTAIDLIKNKLLACLAPNQNDNIDFYYERWKLVIEALGDDYAVQERFFRQYYNAYKYRLKTIANVPLATKSNLIQVYEKLISHDPKAFLDDMVRLSVVYAKLLNRKSVENKRLKKLLLSLARIQAAPAYLVLLIFYDKRTELELSDSHLELITEYLIIFSVRRSATDAPPTRDMTRIFMDLAEVCLDLRGDDIVERVKKHLSRYSASDKRFEESLKGPLYQENKGLCRFLLCALEEEQMTRESQRDLWEIDGKRYTWTIEHIFPQGDNIPQFWVDMMADGNVQLAQEYREKYVHMLGNLTISGYNSKLGNKSFQEKKTRRDQNGKPVGYENGLYLNSDLTSTETWSVEKINSRTETLVDQILEKYSLADRDASQ